MMRALRWHGAKDLRLEQIAIPRPGPEEVRIAVAYCGICGSDLHEYESGPHAIPVELPHTLSGRTAPLTLGHEFCGTVVEVGTEVSHLHIGDRVAVEPEYRCSQCAYCRGGSYNLCTGMGFAGLMGDGGMAEFAVVPSYMLHRLTDGVSLEQAAVLEPAAVALHALRRSVLPTGGSCAIFGLGPIGLLLVMLAKLQGASTIVAVDVSTERLEMARQAGASHIIDANSQSADALRQTIASATEGLGVDVSFEAAGLQATFEGALRALRKGGNMVMVGLMPEARLEVFEAVNRELSLVASVGYRHVYEELMGLIESGQFDPISIVTKTVPLAQAISEGFAALLEDRSQIKILVTPVDATSCDASDTGGTGNTGAIQPRSQP